jgi:hypothetical protein
VTADDSRRIETDSQLEQHKTPDGGAVLHVRRFHKVSVSPEVSLKVNPARRTARNVRIPHHHAGVIHVNNEAVDQVSIVMEGVAARRCALELPVVALWVEQPVGRKTGLGELGINVRGDDEVRLACSQSRQMQIWRPRRGVVAHPLDVMSPEGPEPAPVVVVGSPMRHDGFPDAEVQAVQGGEAEGDGYS